MNDKTSLFGRLGIGGGEVIVDGGYYQIPYADTDIQLGFGIQRSTNIFSNPNGYFALNYIAEMPQKSKIGFPQNSSIEKFGLYPK